MKPGQIAISEIITYKYDDDNNIINKRIYEDEGLLLQEILFYNDFDGNAVKTETIKPLDNKRDTCFFTYDSYKNMLSGHCSYDKDYYEFKYKYDKMKNWTLVSIKRNMGEYHINSKREIQYY